MKRMRANVQFNTMWRAEWHETEEFKMIKAHYEALKKLFPGRGKK